MFLAQITDVKGVGQSTADILAEHNVNTVDDLARINIDVLIAIPGFSGLRAARVISDAQALLVDTATDTGKPSAGLGLPAQQDAEAPERQTVAVEAKKAKKTKKIKKDKKSEKTKNKKKNKIKPGKKDKAGKDKKSRKKTKKK